MATEHNEQKQAHVPLKRESYEATLKKVHTLAADIIEKDGEEHVPMLLLLKFDGDKDEDVGGDIVLAEAFMKDSGRKEVLMDLIRKALQSRRYQLAVLIAEAWTVSLDKPKDGKPIEIPKASEHPDRKECLMVNMYSLDEQYTIPHLIETKDGKRTFERKTIDDALESTATSGLMTLQG